MDEQLSSKYDDRLREVERSASVNAANMSAHEVRCEERYKGILEAHHTTADKVEGIHKLIWVVGGAIIVGLISLLATILIER